ncbi:MAG: helix-turn-helix transcriptional regulator [Lachnospiraceae bacterium]|nr:helix-turn-helix transcriptional regulator [Lachnospiraceae bacterium]
MLYSEVYANRIRSLCRQHGITLNRLATLSGLKQSTIDNIIHGRSRNPKAKTLHKIANTFNMTLSEFLDFPELNDYYLEDEDDQT